MISLRTGGSSTRCAACRRTHQTHMVAKHPLNKDMIPMSTICAPPHSVVTREVELLEGTPPSFGPRAHFYVRLDTVNAVWTRARSLLCPLA